MQRKLLSPVCLLSIALVGAGTTLHSASAVAEQRPFMAMVAGNAHLTPTPDPAVLLNHETGDGQATHLGHFQWEDDEVATFGPGGVGVVASFTMTAASGDELYGEFTSSGSFDEDGNLVIEGNYRFVGGTGLFDGATGSGTIDAIAFLSPGLPFVGEFQGVIDY